MSDTERLHSRFQLLETALSDDVRTMKEITNSATERIKSERVRDSERIKSLKAISGDGIAGQLAQAEIESLEQKNYTVTEREKELFEKAYKHALNSSDEIIKCRQDFNTAYKIELTALNRLKSECLKDIGSPGNWIENTRKAFYTI